MLRGYHLYNKESGSWSCFFFFKQKTAYEIWRDWSSDVCSSDLELPVARVQHEPVPRADRHGLCLRHGMRDAEEFEVEGREGQSAAERDRDQVYLAEQAGLEIGRASCRERV